MNIQQVFDIMGLITTSLGLSLLYLITYFFLNELLGFKYKVGAYILAVVGLAAVILLFFRILPVYLQITISDLFWIMIIFFLCKGNIWVKLYAFITQASVIVLTSLVFVSVDYKVAFFVANSFSLTNPTEMVLLFLIDAARDFIFVMI